MRKALFLVPFALFALQGCGGPDKSDAPKEAADATSGAAGPEAKPGITTTGGLLVLPAVKGRPGVAYFALANGGPATTALAAVHVDGAGKAEMHQTTGGSMQPVNQVELAPDTTVRFERGGLHVMLFDLDAKLAPGGTAEMTLIFADGDKLSTPLKIEAAGGGTAGMDHGEKR